MKKTPLYETHLKLGGRMIDFGGWSMPVQYSGIIEEHRRVRSDAGLFDVSHMGEFHIKGGDASGYIQKMITNDISRMKPGQVIYSPMCYPDGGVVDDLLVYKFSEEEFMLIVNASNTDKDFQWMEDHLEGDVHLDNVSDGFAQLALQGRKAEAILQKLTGESLSEIGFFRFKDSVDLNGITALVSRTGYTGEDGFEIYLDPEEAPGLWDALLKAGSEEGLLPVGLGARDTLRFEAALPLYGQEISKEITPLEARLEKFVNLDKEDFIGKEALQEQLKHGIRRILTGFEMLDRGIPRSHYEIQAEDKNIGFVTTGSFSPSLDRNIGLALVDIRYSGIGSEFDVLVRNKPLKASVVEIPFYAKKYKKYSI